MIIPRPNFWRILVLKRFYLQRWQPLFLYSLKFVSNMFPCSNLFVYACYNCIHSHYIYCLVLHYIYCDYCFMLPLLFWRNIFLEWFPLLGFFNYTSNIKWWVDASHVTPFLSYPSRSRPLFSFSRKWNNSYIRVLLTLSVKILSFILFESRCNPMSFLEPQKLHNMKILALISNPSFGVYGLLLCVSNLSLVFEFGYWVSIDVRFNSRCFSSSPFIQWLSCNDSEDVAMEVFDFLVYFL